MNDFNYVLKYWYRRQFRNELRTCQNSKFSIISSNCIGGLPYKIMGQMYRTPTIGLFFFAPCFIKLASRPSYYLSQPLVFIDGSAYEGVNGMTTKTLRYPIGRIGDIEVHFLHYPNRYVAAEQWNRRLARLDLGRAYYVMTDRDLCTKETIDKYSNLPHLRKLIFTSQAHKYDCSVKVSGFETENQVGDLYNKYEYIYHSFRFGAWLDSKDNQGQWTARSYLRNLQK